MMAVQLVCISQACVQQKRMALVTAPWAKGTLSPRCLGRTETGAVGALKTKGGGLDGWTGQN